VGLTEYEAKRAETAFYEHDRYAIRELADLWSSKKSLDENRAYVARAKELEQDLELALMNSISSNVGDIDEVEPI
jgi:CPA2 family monovalent cation:H+ antiporter-2